jgi:hypothetical protein
MYVSLIVGYMRHSTININQLVWQVWIYLLSCRASFSPRVQPGQLWTFCSPLGNIKGGSIRRTSPPSIPPVLSLLGSRLSSGISGLSGNCRDYHLPPSRPQRRLTTHPVCPATPLALPVAVKNTITSLNSEMFFVKISFCSEESFLSLLGSSEIGLYCFKSIGNFSRS